jgi:pimeloyl-ACP methyl ester carboxylesterase
MVENPKNSGSKTRLIFIHGIGSSAAAWDSVAANSALENYELVRLSLETASTSSAVAEAYGKQIRDAVAAGHGAPTILVGHSMGGLVAGYFATNFEPQPEVKGMILISSALLSLANVVLKPKFRWQHPLLTLKIAFFFASAATPWPTWLLDPVLRFKITRTLALFAVDRRSWRYTYRQALGITSVPKKSSVGKVLADGADLTPERVYVGLPYPARFLTSEFDRLITSSDQAWCLSATAGSKGSRLPGLGHWPHTENPELTSAEIARNVEELLNLSP